MSALLVSLFSAPLLVAAVVDLRSYRIPNVVSGAMLALFPLAALLSERPVDWGSHLLAGALFLGVGAALFALRALGGGDVKLMAATALWLGLGLALPFLVAVGLFGGALTLILLTLRHTHIQAFIQSLAGLPPVLERGAAVPYGVAICAGGLFLAGRLPLL
ncbi:MAG: prepilin peptidase [Alphaproteobacteria bacterium]|nr:prepilin peptidase [Alphaproteobacteria bacterium]